MEVVEYDGPSPALEQLAVVVDEKVRERSIDTLLPPARREGTYVSNPVNIKKLLRQARTLTCTPVLI